MNKAEYLNQLSERLRHLPGVEVERLLNYYDEMIQDRVEDGASEEDAVLSIGSVEDAVNAAMYETSIPTLMKVRFKESKEKASSKTLWMVLLILGAPIWLPLVAVFFSVCLILYCAIWLLVLSAYLIEISFALTAVVGVISSAANLARLSIPLGLSLLGVALVAAAIAMLLFRPLIGVAKALMKGTVLFVMKVKSIFIRKEVAL